MDSAPFETRWYLGIIAEDDLYETVEPVLLWGGIV
jgi:hypothetical protein